MSEPIERLKELRATSTVQRLAPVFEQFEQALDAGRIEDMTAEALLDTLRTIAQRVEQGEPLDAVINQVEPGQVGVHAPNWDVKTVNQATQLLQIFVETANEENETPVEEGLIVPIVLLVMTADDAAVLDSGAAQAGNRFPAAVRHEFKQFRRMLADAGIDRWVDNYHERAEDWQPFGPGEPSIKELVTNGLDALTDDPQPPLVPEFIDLQEALRDRKRLIQLRQKGCVVVVDALSLRHPEFQSMLQKSLLDAYPSNAVVTIAPVAGAIDTAKNLVLVLRLTLAEFEIEKRREDPWEDFHVCYRTAERGDLVRWLQDRAARMAEGKTGIHSEMQLRP